MMLYVTSHVVISYIVKGKGVWTSWTHADKERYADTQLVYSSVARCYCFVYSWQDSSTSQSM